MNNKNFWVLQGKYENEIDAFYKGDGNATLYISDAFKFGTKKSAEMQLQHMIKIGVDISNIEEYIPVEYAVEYTRVGV